MFGVATSTRHLRIETVARNTLSVAVPDATGTLPQSDMIAFAEVESLRMPAPARRLLNAARAARVPAAHLARCRSLSLQLSVLARERGGATTRRPAACGLHPCAAGRPAAARPFGARADDFR